MPRPRLTLARRDHHSALFSLHGQVDGATPVDPDGTTHRYGTTLVPSREAVDTVPPHHAEQREVRCPDCRRVLLVDLPRDHGAPRQQLVCPVCDEPAGWVAIGAATRGGHTSGRERRADRPTPTPSGTARSHDETQQ